MASNPWSVTGTRALWGSQCLSASPLVKDLENKTPFVSGHPSGKVERMLRAKSLLIQAGELG